MNYDYRMMRDKEIPNIKTFQKVFAACLFDFYSSRDGGASLTFTHHTLDLGVPITQVTHPLKHVSNSLQIAVNS